MDNILELVTNALENELGSTDAMDVGAAIDGLQGMDFDTSNELTQDDLLALAQLNGLPDNQQMIIIEDPQESPDVNMQLQHLIDVLAPYDPSIQQSFLDELNSFQGPISEEDLANLNAILASPEESPTMTRDDVDLLGYLSKLDDSELQELFDQAQDPLSSDEEPDEEPEDEDEEEPEFEYEEND